MNETKRVSGKLKFEKKDGQYTKYLPTQEIYISENMSCMKYQFQTPLQ
jgi:hypothetical protein